MKTKTKQKQKGQKSRSTSLKSHTWNISNKNGLDQTLIMQATKIMKLEEIFRVD